MTSFILGSRSPQRRELLGRLVSLEAVRVIPPLSADEAPFDDCRTWDDIERHLRHLAEQKLDDVRSQLTEPHDDIVVTADTVIVVPEPDDLSRLTVLGKPPEFDWQATVREWFMRYLLPRPHFAASAVCVRSQGRELTRVARSEIEFDPTAKQWLDWYLSTEESRGKAGGYGIQGAGGIFVKSVRGSLSNVVGLPLQTLLEMLAELGVAL